MTSPAGRPPARAVPATELVVISREELVQIVEDACESAVRRAAGRPPPALLTRSEIGEAIRACSKTVARLEADGLPYLRVGDVHRYQLPAVLAWLESRGK